MFSRRENSLSILFFFSLSLLSSAFLLKHTSSEVVEEVILIVPSPFPPRPPDPSSPPFPAAGDLPLQKVLASPHGVMQLGQGGQWKASVLIPPHQLGGTRARQLRWGLDGWMEWLDFCNPKKEHSTSATLGKVITYQNFSQKYQFTVVS